MPISFNHEDAQSRAYEPLESGEYVGTLTNVKSGVYSTGTEFMELAFVVDEPVSGRIWHRYALTPKALWRLKKDLLPLGVSPESMARDYEETEDFRSIVEDQAVGSDPVLLDVGQEKNEETGRIYNRIQGIYSKPSTVSAKKVVSKK